MAVNTFTAPRCEIRRVVIHFYPDGIKGGAYPCEQRFFGRRGQPVKTMRFVSPVKAFAIAKALQVPDVNYVGGRVDSQSLLPS
jgi:hypothetical protein